MYQEIVKYEADDIKIRIELDGKIDRADEKMTSAVWKHFEGIIEAIRVSRIMTDPSFKADKKINTDRLLRLFPPLCGSYEEIPNEYWSGHLGLATPWLIVHTHIGAIKIGWRKRVIYIDWSKSNVSETADILFPHENVTKGPFFIHAWGEVKAAEYLEKLLVPGD